MTDPRPVHLSHPAMSNHTLCGYLVGDGVRMDEPVITCEGCRAVVQYCRHTVRIGQLPQVSR